MKFSSFVVWLEPSTPKRAWRARNSENLFATVASAAANNALNLLLQFEQILQGVRIYRLDVFGLFHAIAADATHFGFTDITTPCLNPVTNVVCADPARTLFWDVEHPTEFGHAFFAVQVETALTR